MYWVLFVLWGYENMDLYKNEFMVNGIYIRLNTMEIWCFIIKKLCKELLL